MTGTSAYRMWPAETFAAGQCLNCRTWIFATTAREWKRAVTAPCPACGAKGW